MSSEMVLLSLLSPEDSSSYGQNVVQRSDRTMWYDKKAVVTIWTLMNEYWGPQFQEGIVVPTIKINVIKQVTQFQVERTIFK